MADVEQFSAVTGAEASVASHYLELSGADLGKALDLFFRQPDLAAGPSAASAAGPSSARPDVSDDDVQELPPQPPLKGRLRRKAKRETTTNGQGPSTSNGRSTSKRAMPVPEEVVDIDVDEEDGGQTEDGVRAPIPATSGVLVDASFATSYAGPRRVATGSVFDSFSGDFRAAAEAQRRALEGLAPEGPVGKRRLLADLFRPPSQLLFQGSWEQAKGAAAAKGLWLLVNLQSASEFACQTLNRDVWKNGTVEALVRGNFVFWQASDETPEGRRFAAYYAQAAQRRPFVGVVDPRTGELVRELRRLQDPASFCDAASDFLSDLPTLADLDARLSAASSKATKRKALSEAADEAQAKHRRVEAEAEELRSRMETGLSTRSFEELCSAEGRPLRLQVRFPDEGRRPVELGAETKVEALEALAAERGFPPQDHQLLLTFPRRVLQPSAASLQSLALNDQEILYVERR